MGYGRNISLLGAAALILVAPSGFAAEVALVGTIGHKAIVVINGGAPRTLAPGQETAEGVLLISTEKDSASFDIDGKRRMLRVGPAYSAPAHNDRQSVVLKANARGHFVTMGSINEGNVRFLVDTGATFITLPAKEAKRLGIDYLKGRRGQLQTPNGPVSVYQVKLDSVKIGDIRVNNVDAVVGGSASMGVALLGMSFLNRMEMKRDGQSMILTKRY